MDLNDVLQKLNNPIKLFNNKYQAKCPCHDDKKESLSITAKDGKVLIHCHAGCDYVDIIKALGLYGSNNQKKEIDEIYDYTDKNGKLVYQTIRYKDKSFRQRQPIADGKWQWNLKGVKKVLYNLPAVLAAIKENKFIFVVEGEKDSNTIIKQNLTATTNPLGACKWHADYTKTLKDARVCIIGDNDEAGIKHAELVANKIIQSARETRILTLSGLEDKQDVTDWFNQDHTVKELKTLTLNSPLLTDEIPESPEEETNIPIESSSHRALTDLGNSERFFDQHHTYLRYNHTDGKWLYWNGKNWDHDKKGKINRFAKETARRIYNESDQEENDKVKKLLYKHAIRTESRINLSNMIELSKSISGIASTEDDFDQDNHLMNLKNGIYDLDEMEFIDHEQNYNMTKICNVEYLEEYEYPEWQNFLNKIFDNDEQFILFIQKSIGLCLSGDVKEQVLFFCYGTGANGKSTFFEVIRMLLGDYYQKAPSEMLLVKQFSSGANNDIARLAGKRFVIASELPSGKRLNEQIIKDLTGNDVISARFLHKEYFEFKPTHKLWIYGNHKPQIRDTDEGIWRRICLIPFLIRIPKDEQIPQMILLDKFKDEMSGILNWAIKGLKLYNDEGLDRPDEVIKATETYREDSDILGLFINKCCIVKMDVKCSVKLLYDEYSKWAEEEKEKFILSKRIFVKNIVERGYEKRPSTDNQTFIWGLGLLHGNKESDQPTIFDEDDESLF